ncbi:NADPH-dependent FMN reductase [compost metagenome]
MNIGIIIGGTRPGRRGPEIANWIYGIASKRDDAHFEIVDIADFDLPLLDEPVSAIRAGSEGYTKEHTKK